jgi:hypothetical protein
MIAELRGQSAIQARSPGLWRDAGNRFKLPAKLVSGERGLKGCFRETAETDRPAGALPLEPGNGLRWTIRRNHSSDVVDGRFSKGLALDWLPHCFKQPVLSSHSVAQLDRAG